MREFKIKRTDGDDDYIAIIENLTDRRLFFVFEGINGHNFDIGAYDWIGISGDEHGWEKLRLLENKNFVVFQK